MLDPSLLPWSPREETLAHNILKTAVSRDKEQNFIAFVGQSHFVNIVRKVMDFLKNGEEFVNFDRTPHKQYNSLENTQENLARWGLANAIFEIDEPLPFKHRDLDKFYMKVNEAKGVKRTSLGTFIEDIEDFGLTLTKDDFVDEKTRVEQSGNLDKTTRKYAEEYVKEKGGMLACLPLGYLQSNLMYNHCLRRQLADEATKDPEFLASNYCKILDE